MAIDDLLDRARDARRRRDEASSELARLRERPRTRTATRRRRAVKRTGTIGEG